MADDDAVVTPPTPAPDPAAQAAAEAATARKADSDRLAGIDARLSALADTVKGALAPRAPVQSGEHMAPGTVPAHFRQLLRQQGLTEADIDANAPVIVPFLSAMLATDGAVIASGIQQVRDEVDMVKAARNTKSFPYWSDLEDKIIELRDEAQKQNQYLSPKDAYKAAVALDVQSDESRVEVAKARRKEAAASSAADVTAQNLGVHHGSKPTAGTVRRTALSAEDVASLSREDRKKLFESIGDLPIR